MSTGRSPQNRNRTGNRGPDGRFLPGNSANPGGRPKAEQTVIELAREHTDVAIRTLAGICQDKSAADAARVAAARHLLDRAWGRPRQSVEFLEPVSLPPSIAIELVSGVKCPSCLERMDEEQPGEGGSELP